MDYSDPKHPLRVLVWQRVRDAAQAMCMTFEGVQRHLLAFGINIEYQDALDFMESRTTLAYDAEQVFVGGKGNYTFCGGVTPPLCSKEQFGLGWSILRGCSHAPSGQWAQLGDEDLLKRYADNPELDICAELSKRANGAAFLHYADGKLDIYTSLRLLRLARRKEAMSVGKLYRVGERPA